MRELDVAKVIDPLEILGKRAVLRLPCRVSDLIRKPTKRPLRAVVPRILFGDFPQMPYLQQVYRTPASEIVMVHEVGVCPSIRAGRKPCRKVVKSELCLTRRERNRLAPAVEVFTWMAGRRRV